MGAPNFSGKPLTKGVWGKELEGDYFFMRVALDEARTALNKGEIPVGAVVIINDEIVSRGYNIKESLNDPTAHAEIIAIKKASLRRMNWRLEGATLYVTKEPCLMCAGAILNSRIRRVVYGCKDVKGGAVESLYNLLSDSRLNHQVNVTSGILEEECRGILEGFFETIRHNSSEY